MVHSEAMLPHLIRTAEVARLLGVSKDACLKWCRRLEIPLFQCPPRGMPTSRPDGTKPGRNAPAYLSIAAALDLVKACLPGLAAKAQRERARVYLGKVGRARSGSQVRRETTLMQTGQGVPGGTGHP